jgi:DNA-binding transcriptional regulator YiaG
MNGPVARINVWFICVASWQKSVLVSTMVLAYRQIRCTRCGARRRMIDGASLRAARERLGLSLRACATHLGVSAAYLSDVERNLRNCTPAFLKKYERVTHG